MLSSYLFIAAAVGVLEHMKGNKFRTWDLMKGRELVQTLKLMNVNTAEDFDFVNEQDLPPFMSI